MTSAPFYDPNIKSLSQRKTQELGATENFLSVMVDELNETPGYAFYCGKCDHIDLNPIDFKRHKTPHKTTIDSSFPPLIPDEAKHEQESLQVTTKTRSITSEEFEGMESNMQQDPVNYSENQIGMSVCGKSISNMASSDSGKKSWKFDINTGKRVMKSNIATMSTGSWSSANNATRIEKGGIRTERQVYVYYKNTTNKK